MKKIILTLLVVIVVAAGALFVVNGTSNYDPSKYTMAITPNDKDMEVGSEIAFTLPDQFDKSYTLSKDVKKIVFAFTKDTGHTISAYMQDKKDDFLASNNAIIVADVSGMPVVIQNTFALPGLKKSNYRMMLIYDKEMASKIKNGKDTEKVVIFDLDNGKVKSINFASDAKELDKYLN